MDKNEPFLTSGQPYDVSLQLNLPESQVNSELGNVMALIELKSFENRTVFVESRPVIIYPNIHAY